MLLPAAHDNRVFERGFVLSDHADFPGLLSAIDASRAKRVLVTHGTTESLAKLLRERGLDAMSLHTPFTGALPPDQSADLLEKLAGSDATQAE